MQYTRYANSIYGCVVGFLTNNHKSEPTLMADEHRRATKNQLSVTLQLVPAAAAASVGQALVTDRPLSCV